MNAVLSTALWHLCILNALLEVVGWLSILALKNNFYLFIFQDLVGACYTGEPCKHVSESNKI